MAETRSEWAAWLREQFDRHPSIKKNADLVRASGTKENGRPVIDASSVTQWLRGRRPSFELAVAAARAFGMPEPDALYAAGYLVEAQAHSGLPSVTQVAAGTVHGTGKAQPPALSVVPAIVTSPLDDEDDEDNPVLTAIRDDPDLDDIGRDHFASQYKILRKFAQYRREVERLPYVAHGQREEPVDEAEEARVEEAARRAALENPHSPTNDPPSPEGHK